MGFLRRLIGGLDEREAPPAPPARVQLELEDHRTPTLENGLDLVAGAGGIKAVGESFYRGALVKVTGGQRHDGVKMYLTATLVREPNNRYDPNAVAVQIDGKIVAHLTRAKAAAYKPVLDRIAAAGRIAYCSAQVYGGWDRGDGDQGDFSVTVYIGTPAEQEALVNREATAGLAAIDPAAEYANNTCPYCSVPLEPLPKAKKKCPSCGQAVQVRRGPDGLRYLLQTVDLPAMDQAWAEYRGQSGDSPSERDRD